MPPATTMRPKPKAKPKPTPTGKVLGEHHIFTDLLDAVRPIAVETSLLLENEDIFGTVRLYDLLHMYCETEFNNEVLVRREERRALAESADLQTQRRLRIAQSHQAVLRFYNWLAENGYIARHDYAAVLARAKETLNAVLA